MRKLLVAAILLVGITPAHAANERAVRALRHFAALSYRAYYAPAYRGTPSLPGAMILRPLGGPLVSLHRAHQVQVKAFQDQVKAVRGLSN